MQAMATLANQARILVIMIRIGNSKIRLAMKKFFRSVMLVAVAAMGFVACQNEFDEPNVNQPVADGVVVTFVADEPATRTAVDTSSDEAPVFSWSDNENFAVLEQTDALAVGSNVTFEKVDGKANITATFAKNEGKSEYKYVTVHPASGYVSAESIASATLALPANQTMASGSYDPNADLMVSKVVTSAAQPTEAQQVEFTRLVAVVKMTLKNFNLEAGDEVEKVVFMADGKALAGTITADLNAPHEFTVAEGVSSVSVATTARDYIYFNVLPTVLEAGDSYTAIVITNKRLYVKQGSVPAESTLTLEAGMVNRFSVNMMGVMPSEKWTLVRDASTLKQGDIVTIAAKNYNYVIGKQGTNYPIASKTEVVKYGDYLYHPIATAETSVDNRMQCYTLMQRDANRVAFDFYNGVDYEGDTTVGFVYANGSNYAPKIQAFCDVNTLFDVTITDGAATLYASEIEKTNKWWRYYHSTSAGSRRFDCTTSEPTGNNQVCIYRVEGAVGTIPTIDANVTVPDADESVVIAEEGATAISTEQVTFNYVGEWTISAEAEAEWLSVAYDAANNCLTYTAEANTGAKRETMVTITASMEGHESLTWSFTVQQKGAPQEITIAELRAKTKDESTTYKVTGQVKTVPTNSTGNWEIVDENGNVAKIAYLKTDAGGYAKDVCGIKVGDVMTVTTIVTGTNGTYACGKSAYPSTYKGHFTVEATTNDVIGYEGGDATISVAVKTYGHIVAPTAISDNSNVATDGNPLSAYSFTDNGDGTATAVASFSENTTGGSRKVDLTFSSGLPLVVSTTISIIQDVNPALKTGWWLVTDVNDLEAGDKIIIAATGLDYAISTATNAYTRKSTAITRNGGALENVSESVQQYALEIDANGLYSFKGTLGDDDGKYIYAASSSNNRMMVTSTLDDNGKFTIAIDSEGAATIIAQGANTRNVMQYNNKTTSSPSFYCTDGSFGAVCLYKYFE